MKRPLAGLVVTYASGIWIGSLVALALTPLLVASAGCLILFLFVRRTPLARITLFAAVFVLGMAGYRQATTISSPIDITRLLEPRDQSVNLAGRDRDGYGRRDTPAGETDSERLRFSVEVRAVQRNGQWVPATGTILVFVSDAHAVAPLRYGDLIQFSGVLRVPETVRNPGAFDWRGWLEQRGIHFTATIRKDDALDVAAHGQGNPVIAASLRLSRYLERSLRLGLEDEPKLAGALAGMVIGERSEIPTETYKDFQRTGVFHVFSINGLHVGLVAGIVLIVLRAARIPRRWCAVAAVPVLVLYVFATGAHPGAVRALIMACAWLIGWMLVRPADTLNSLGAAALVILLGAPTQLFNSGFLLVVFRRAGHREADAVHRSAVVAADRDGPVPARGIRADLEKEARSTVAMGHPTVELFRGGVARSRAVDGVVFQPVHADQHRRQPPCDPDCSGASSHSGCWPRWRTP